MSDEMHVLDLLPAYALGSLEANEARLVEKHLSSCLVCRSKLSDFQNAADELNFAVPVSVPPPDLKDRLMQRVQSSRSQPQIPVSVQVSRRPWLERLLPVWGLASLFLIIALAVFSALLWQRLNHLEFASTPGGMLAFPLNAVNSGSNVTGFVLVSADGRNGALVVDRLPKLDAGQQYQLWLIRDHQTISAAVFSPDEENYRSLQIESEVSLFEYSTVSITIEPAGGSSQPTGVQVLRGQLVNQ